MVKVFAPPNPTQVPLVLWDKTIAYCWLIEFCVHRFFVESFIKAGIALPSRIAASAHKRQVEYFHGRLAARYALASYGLEKFQVETGMMGEPVWPSGIIGSITHSQYYAAAVALPSGRNGGIGIDIERFVDHDEDMAVSHQIVSARELMYLSSLSFGMTLSDLVIIVFSAKESFYKAAFRLVGRFFDFHAVEVIFLCLVNRTLRLRVKETLCPDLPVGAVIRIAFSFVDESTVCTSCSLPPWLERSACGYNV